MRDSVSGGSALREVDPGGGAKGIFSTAAVVVSRKMVSTYDGVNEGACEEARSSHLKLLALNGLLEYDPGYVEPCKEALRLLGLPGRPVRKPLPELTPDERRRVRKALQALGMIRQSFS